MFFCVLKGWHVLVFWRFVFATNELQQFAVRKYWFEIRRIL
jgi:hypothetical protein